MKHNLAYNITVVLFFFYNKFWKQLTSMTASKFYQVTVQHNMNTDAKKVFAIYENFSYLNNIFFVFFFAILIASTYQKEVRYQVRLCQVVHTGHEYVHLHFRFFLGIHLRHKSLLFHVGPKIYFSSSLVFGKGIVIAAFGIVVSRTPGKQTLPPPPPPLMPTIICILQWLELFALRFLFGRGGRIECSFKKFFGKSCFPSLHEGFIQTISPWHSVINQTGPSFRCEIIPRHSK